MTVGEPVGVDVLIGTMVCVTIGASVVTTVGVSEGSDVEGTVGESALLIILVAEGAEVAVGVGKRGRMKPGILVIRAMANTSAAIANAAIGTGRNHFAGRLFSIHSLLKA